MVNENSENKRKHEDSDEDDQPVNQTSIEVLNHFSVSWSSLLASFLFSVSRVTGGKKVVQSRLCPYLDTINRNVLDFDFEKLCSVSLTRINVYACLVCGKYFQGMLHH